MTPIRVLTALLAAVGVLIVAELAAGALDFGETRIADACTTEANFEGGGIDGAFEGRAGQEDAPCSSHGEDPRNSDRRAANSEQPSAVASGRILEPAGQEGNDCGQGGERAETRNPLEGIEAQDALRDPEGHEGGGQRAPTDGEREASGGAGREVGGHLAGRAHGDDSGDDGAGEHDRSGGS